MNHSTRRLQALSDAVLAIAATVLCVPLAKIDPTVRLDMYMRGKSLSDVLTSDYQVESFIMFVGSFFVVYLVWVRHGRQFSRLTREQAARETPALMMINMLELFLATMLPYTTASAARARLTAVSNSDDRRDLAMPFCLNIFALATTRIIFESFALRARPSVAWGFLSLAEAVFEVSGAMLILILATFAFPGEQIFFPFLAIPVLSALVHLGLISVYGDPENKKMDWVRLEGFVDGCVAIVTTLMIVDVRPPADCVDMKLETCVLHFPSGCRVKVHMDSPFSRSAKCYFRSIGDQQSETALLAVAYFACFCLVFFLWYTHHEIIWYGYAPQRRKGDRSISASLSSPEPLTFAEKSGRAEGVFRAFVGSAWFCMSLGLFPFAFSLVAEFGLKDHLGDFPRLHKLLPAEFQKPLDPGAGRTAFLFALVVLVVSVFPLTLLFVLAPKRYLVPYSVVCRILSFPICVFLNILLLFTIGHHIALWPMLALGPAVAISDCLGGWLTMRMKRFAPEIVEEYSEHTTPLIVNNPDYYVVPGVISELAPQAHRALESSSDADMRH